MLAEARGLRQVNCWLSERVRHINLGFDEIVPGADFEGGGYIGYDDGISEEDGVYFSEISHFCKTVKGAAEKLVDGIEGHIKTGMSDRKDVKRVIFWRVLPEVVESESGWWGYARLAVREYD